VSPAGSDLRARTTSDAHSYQSSLSSTPSVGSIPTPTSLRSGTPGTRILCFLMEVPRRPRRSRRTSPSSTRRTPDPRLPRNQRTSARYPPSRLRGEDVPTSRPTSSLSYSPRPRTLPPPLPKFIDTAPPTVRTTSLDTFPREWTQARPWTTRSPSHGIFILGTRPRRRGTRLYCAWGGSGRTSQESGEEDRQNRRGEEAQADEAASICPRCRH
jgi:hypothetical protein